MVQEHQARVPVVGVGASAGGIEALELLFRAMPTDTGAAFVVVTHLSPQHESALPAILQRFTEMPVVSAEDTVAVEPDRVYVMPENATLTFARGRLRLKRPRSAQRESRPFDLFLSALALDQGEYAAAIILSGTDGDGTLGAKAIKEHGGLTLAQVADGTAPRYPSMPQTAIASGVIDIAVPAQDMPAHLVTFVNNLNVLDRPEAETGADEMAQLEKLRPDIYALLEGQIGHDFSGYKTRTFNRRIQRRMQILQLSDTAAYVDVLRQDTSEVAALFRDLLINVTNFFRDADAFVALKEVVAGLLEGKTRDDTIRVWVPGCATGEEVYSIAILMREHMDAKNARPRVQIFATDIDDRSLEIARGARYPEPLLSTVSAERRRRYFTADGSSFVVNKDVRELCIFSPHSLIRDPPFSRMDLVSCRNLLIYLAPNLQGQVIPLFHYSLRPQGYLFLGTSENIGQFSDLFTPVDKKQRLFRARENTGASLRLPLLPRVHPSDLMSSVGAGSKLSTMQSLRQDVDARVVERYAPAHVVINADSDIVLYSSRTGKYLEAAPGVPSRQLIAMARRGVRMELRGAIREAVSERRRAERHELAVEMDDGRLQMVTIAVEPLEVRSEEPLFIVLFFDTGVPIPREQAVVRVVGDQSGAMSALERELLETRERLQSLIEEYETALEELKSSNEELVSVNEELQSTNEELEASKEELQSLNEELQTVNAELGHKIDELDQSNSDLRNLFDTSKMATIFVNRDMTIRNFTPLAAAIFNLVPADRGRSLTIFTSPLVYPDFLADIGRTIDDGKPIEKRVLHESNATQYLVRLQPYQTGAGRSDGATITLVDITSLSASDDADP